MNKSKTDGADVAPATATEPPAAGPKAKVKITITAKREGFRRCGVAHGAQPVEHAVDAFTPAEWAQISGDPMLVVSGDLPPAPKGTRK